jgi:hypothetical protein
MKFYTKVVPFEMAQNLKKAGYKDYGTESRYANGKVTVSGMINETLKKGEYFNYNTDYVVITGKSIPAPTYAEVFDWLIVKGFDLGVTILRLDGKHKYGCYISDIRDTPDVDISCPYKNTWDEAVNHSVNIVLQMMKGKKAADIARDGEM